MATEITCVLRDPDHPERRITGVGGPGWTHDEATVIGEIAEGWGYFVQVGAARVRVVVLERDGRPYLRTDPEESAENNLLALPSCPLEPARLGPR